MLPAKVGIEVEIQGLSRNFATNLGDSWAKWDCSYHDDRSVRCPTVAVDGISCVPPFHTSSSVLALSRTVGVTSSGSVGMEIVTPALDPEKAVEFAQHVRVMLGHLPRSNDASIHIHMDVVGKSWRFIQNLTKIFYWLEPAIYKLSSSSRQHRGEKSSYQYMRPLSYPTGVVSVSGVLTSLFSVENVLRANSATDFLYAWGRLDHAFHEQSPYRGSHYLPHRLSGLNIQSVLRQGSVELRIFDPIYRDLPYFLNLSLLLYKKAASPYAADELERRWPQRMEFGRSFDAELHSLAEFFEDKEGVIAYLWGNSSSGFWPSVPELHLNHYHERNPFILDHRINKCPFRAKNLSYYDTGEDNYSLFADRKEI